MLTMQQRARGGNVALNFAWKPWEAYYFAWRREIPRREYSAFLRPRPKALPNLDQRPRTTPKSSAKRGAEKVR
jgi:hypothetical protein